MNPVLARWNALDAESAANEVLPCCGSRVWAREVTAKRPYVDEQALLKVASEEWLHLSKGDWQEAFDSHPRIGQRHAIHATAQSLRWSEQEQSKAASSNDDLKDALADANARYEERFGRIFIICATSKTTTEILEMLERRMKNDPATELRETAEQQRQITQLRLHRWLGLN
jgi:2-oxo-4-hydroxy-4-carboxy-5-ureidoimidazoline decarboxylase